MELYRRMILSNMLKLKYAQLGLLNIHVIKPHFEEIRYSLVKELGDTIIYIGRQEVNSKPYATIITKKDEDVRGLYVVYPGGNHEDIKFPEGHNIYAQVGGVSNYNKKGIINLISREGDLDDYRLLREFLLENHSEDQLKYYMGVHRIKGLSAPGIIGYYRILNPPICHADIPSLLKSDFDKSSAPCLVAKIHYGNPIVRGRLPAIDGRVGQRELIIMKALGHWFYGTVSHHEKLSQDNYLLLFLGHSFFFRNQLELNQIEDLYQRCVDFPIKKTFVVRYDSLSIPQTCSDEIIQHLAVLNSSIAPYIFFGYSRLDLHAANLRADHVALVGEDLFKSLDNMGDFTQSIASTQSRIYSADVNRSFNVREGSMLNISVDSDATQIVDYQEEHVVESLSQCQLGFSVFDASDIGDAQWNSVNQSAQPSQEEARRSQAESQRSLESSQKSVNYESHLQEVRNNLIYDRFFSFPIVRLGPKHQYQFQLSGDDLEAFMEAFQQDFRARTQTKIYCVAPRKTSGIEAIDVTGETYGERFVLLLFLLNTEIDIMCVVVDREYREFISFGHRNLMLKDGDLCSGFEIGLAEYLPETIEYKHCRTNVMCPSFQEVCSIHLLVSLTTILDYMSLYPRLPEKIIYPPTLLCQMIRYLVLSRACANYEVNRGRNEDELLGIPAMELPRVENMVVRIDQCPFCSKRQLKSLRGVARHIRMKYAGGAIKAREARRVRENERAFEGSEDELSF